jgi:hypothetical protein
MAKFNVGDEVVSIVSGAFFRVAGVDDDCVLRAEDGAWLHEDDVDHADADTELLN